MTEVSVLTVSGRSFRFTYNEPIQVVREKIKAVMVEDSPYIRFRDVFFVRESIECVRVLESED